MLEIKSATALGAVLRETRTAFREHWRVEFRLCRSLLAKRVSPGRNAPAAWL